MSAMVVGPFCLLLPNERVDLGVLEVSPASSSSSELSSSSLIEFAPVLTFDCVAQLKPLVSLPFFAVVDSVIFYLPEVSTSTPRRKKLWRPLPDYMS
mmetsp:Transcript_3472/g.5593  ORF Transcript_3472/g.5593 Transcript_3472/m.5593 type:complete len:97 (+) Transcript_3472:1323-1613(+)